MDGDFRIDLDEAFRNIEVSEVISIYFPLFRKTLLIDARYSQEESPMVKIVPMALSIEERSRTLKKLRPNFEKPKSITVLPWPKYVNSLVGLGIWEKVLQRLVDSGHTGVIKRCSRLLDDLYEFESKELAAVIQGDNYQTMWARTR